MRSKGLAATYIMALIAGAAPWFSGTAVGQTGASIEERIAALEARESIRELIYAYGHALDHRDFVAFAALFEPESGTWTGGFGTATGSDAIFKLMDERIGHAEQPAEATSHHVFTNIQIEVDGGEAAATTKWIFVVAAPDGAPQWRFLGHYEDRFVQRDGRWYFLRREAFTDLPQP
jgi:3-phenylpropionate/cinnamic acid dioxygenase small subunit